MDKQAYFEELLKNAEAAHDKAVALYEGVRASEGMVGVIPALIKISTTLAVYNLLVELEPLIVND